MKTVKVLVVDDSATVRKVLTTILEMDSGIEVIHAAKDPYEARDILVESKPDVMRCFFPSSKVPDMQLYGSR